MSKNEGFERLERIYNRLMDEHYRIKLLMESDRHGYWQEWWDNFCAREVIIGLMGEVKRCD